MSEREYLRFVADHSKGLSGTLTDIQTMMDAPLHGHPVWREQFGASLLKAMTSANAFKAVKSPDRYARSHSVHVQANDKTIEAISILQRDFDLGTPFNAGQQYFQLLDESADLMELALLTFKQELDQ